MHECGIFHRLLWRSRPHIVSVGNELNHLLKAAALLIGSLDVNLSGLVGAFIDELLRLAERGENRARHLWVRVAEFLRHQHHAIGRRPAERVVGFKHVVHTGCRQLIVIIWCDGVVAVNLGGLRDHRYGGVRMGAVYRERIEF